MRQKVCQELESTRSAHVLHLMHLMQVPRRILLGSKVLRVCCLRRVYLWCT
jgi:hypothetical protein